jgi:hypothetical protein
MILVKTNHPYLRIGHHSSDTYCMCTSLHDDDQQKLALGNFSLSQIIRQSVHLYH